MRCACLCDFWIGILISTHCVRTNQSGVLRRFFKSDRPPRRRKNALFLFAKLFLLGLISQKKKPPYKGGFFYFNLFFIFIAHS